MDTLQRASQAWQQLKTAEAEIYRLSKYRQLSKTMREDRLRHAQAAGDARKVLDEVLKVAK